MPPGGDTWKIIMFMLPGGGGARHYYLRRVPRGLGHIENNNVYVPWGRGMHLVRQTEDNNVYVSALGGDIDIIIFNLFALGHIQDDNACPPGGDTLKIIMFMLSRGGEGTTLLSSMCPPGGWGTLKIIMCMFPGGRGMHIVRHR